MRFPLSFAEQRLWFLDQLKPGEPTYNMPYATWLDGPLDVSALQRAMDALVARHAALRTSFVVFDSMPEQVVAGSAAVPIERIGLPAGLDDGERIRRAEAIAADRACQPFDLAAGPLVRVTLIAAGPDQHLLVLVLHHIISDGMSMEILTGELSAVYRAETTGTPASLPPLWMEYGDYAVWQLDRMRGEELDRQLSYWREQFRGAPLLLALPADRPRPARQSSHGAVTTVTIDAGTTSRLTAVAHEANATTFMVFLAGFAAVLSRYARETDIVIGIQAAGRTHTELEPIVGMFTNTIPLRISLAGDPTFAALLGRVRDTTVDAIVHQQVPFEKLVEEFAPDRTLGHIPLVQVGFAYGSLTPANVDFPGITSRSRVLRTGTSKFDINLDTDPRDGRTTQLALEYSTDRFGSAWADRFLRCVWHLLEHAANAPGTPVADLPMLSATDHDALIGRNRQALPTDDDSVDVRRLIQASTSRVIDGDGAQPMSQVCDRAARIARALTDRGAGPDTLVGLCVGRGSGMLAALLGVWWAGGAYVPLDPGFPKARLATMTRIAGLRIIISDSAHRDLACSVAGDAEVICADDPAATAGSPLAPVPLPPGALAYMIFTSGPAGPPRGVAVEHRNVANQLASSQRLLKLGSDDCLVAVTALSSDAHVLELALPALCDADLVIAATGDACEPGRLRSLIERTGATALQATPQTWRLLAAAGGVPGRVRLRLSGGGALPPDLAEQLMAPGVTLWNVYGPAETTIWATAGVVTRAAEAAEIGPPIDHARVYVLDEHLMPVPAGVLGEVWFAGRGIASGYHGRPGITARSFRPDPWSDEPGARMYRSGDLGRWREDASLELAGRNDHQVKIRGFRVELGEIEAALRAHRDVRQAAVVAATRAGELALVAYVMPRRGSALAQPGADPFEELRPHLRAALPGYMIPALVVALPALPLTPAAKVDRAALPAPQWGGAPPAPGNFRDANDL
jgi:amino acid adenylation domain-containing protein